MVNLKNRLFFCIGIICCLSSWPGDAGAQANIFASKGQVVYAPVYSHIYIGDKERPFLLAVTLSIRNTDSDYPIMVEKVKYYNSDGKLLEEYIKRPVKLGKMSATRFVVHESDKSGGSGASFIVEWRAEKAVSPPLIETIMIGAQTQQGISFTSRGRVIREK
ncbi:MAG: DUF3124 domain-containing protein [Desulfatiglandaceae bacterium]